MAQPEEPMDIDSSVCDFDDKENAFHHNNVHTKTPSTEKGYEELDVSELNMKLRYSMTPAASPMSKSFDNKHFETNNIDTGNSNMTRSLHTKNDTLNLSQKTLPLQSLLTDHSQVSDGNRNILQPLESTLTPDKNITVTVSQPNDDDHLSLPSSSSSMTHTPEATTPTKEIPIGDGSSPIIRGLKSVLNMFRPSQSPIPGEEDAGKLETLSPPIVHSPDTSQETKYHNVSASTPVTSQKTKDSLTKINSQNRDSIVFNEDLEKELEWKDDSTILFSHEKIPIHKLFYQQPKSTDNQNTDLKDTAEQNNTAGLNKSVEYMDISYNESGMMDKTMTKLPDLGKSGIESDCEFLDCESTFTKDDSFKAPYDPNSTKNVIAHINYLVEDKSTASIEIVNESEHDDLSNASKETTKLINTSDVYSTVLMSASDSIISETDIKTLPEELKQDLKIFTLDSDHEETKLKAKVDSIEDIPAVSTLDIQNTTQVINLVPNVANRSYSIDNVNVSDICGVENVCVKSLSQIPLIVDPRVLLFNIPEIPECSNNDNNSEKLRHFKDAIPADIPLPDDDMPSLPLMNTELENISNTLDKIAEEIPKINQHDSISSVHSLSDNKLLEKENTIVAREPKGPMDLKMLADVTKDLGYEESENTTNNDIFLLRAEENFGQTKRDDLQKDTHASDNTQHNFTITNNYTDINTSTQLLSDFNNAFENHMTKNNVDVIKQEIEGIVNMAVNVAAEKSNMEIVNKINKTCKETNNHENENNFTSNEVPTVIDMKIMVIDNVSSIIETQTECQNLIEPKSVEFLNESTSILQEKLPCNFDNFIDDVVPLTKKLTHQLAEKKKSNNCNEIVCNQDTPTISSVDIVSDIANKELCKGVNIDNQGLESDVHLNPEIIENPVMIEREEVVSENNSPFLIISNERDDVEVNPIENIEDVKKSFISLKTVQTPPSSPVIVSKGYNFDFDEIEDPFATKTKIRMSPALDSFSDPNFDKKNDEQEPIKKEADKTNRRKTQPNRRPVVTNKKLNSTFAGKSNKDKSVLPALKSVSPHIKSCKTKDGSGSADINTSTANCDSPLNNSTVPLTIDNELAFKSSSNENMKNSSTSEAKFQTDIKITDFNDPNFDPFAPKFKIQQSPPPQNEINPFATRSRICQTPPPSLQLNENLLATKCNNSSSPENTSVISVATEMPPVLTAEGTKVQSLSTNDRINETENSNTAIVYSNTQDVKEIDNGLDDKESSKNISGTTCSSSNEKVNTEDEDTVEGPFLDVDDLLDHDNLSDFGEENVNIVQFSDIPASNGENPEAGELFIDAEAFEFLLNQKQEHVVSDSGKESLFLKFDPLFLKRVSSDGVAAALKQVQGPKKQSIPLKDKITPITGDTTFSTSSIPIIENPLIPRDATFDNSCFSSDDTKPLTASDATFDMLSIPQDNTYDKSTPFLGPSGLKTTQDLEPNSSAEESYEDCNVTVAKPMMVVNPALNSFVSWRNESVTPRNKTMTPVRSNRQSLTFTSPAIAVIDRLLSMSASNNSSVSYDATVAEVCDNQADLALTQLRELLADKEISVYNLRSETRELQNRLANLESQTITLEKISADRLRKINELNETLNEKTKINKKMANVVEEYERTIASLIADTELDKKQHAEERLQLIRERDEQTAHLASMEVSFSDLHSKYEKTKLVILGFKSTEETIKKSIKETEESLAKMIKNYEQLKQHATSKLNHANEELQKMNRAHEAEVLKMNALLKRKELHINSLEETLQQKTKANEELTAICDELINKVG